MLGNTSEKLSIRYIKIHKNFMENTQSNWEISNMDDYVKMLNENDGSFSVFEVLNKYHKVRLYFDIENIPRDQDKLIFDIINGLLSKIVELSNLKGNKNAEDIEYILTENKHSHTHEGRSYHLIIYSLSTEMRNIQDFLNYYVGNKFIGYEYIDLSVYSQNRLFRAVNQKGVSRDGDQLYEDDKHEIIRNHINDLIIYEDGLIPLTVIQHTHNTEEIYFTISYKDKITYRKMMDKNKVNKFSGPFYRNQPMVKNTFIFNGVQNANDVSEIIKNTQPYKPLFVPPTRPTTPFIQKNPAERAKLMVKESSTSGDEEETTAETKKETTQEKPINEDEQIYNKFVSLREFASMIDENNKFEKLFNEIIEHYKQFENFNEFRLNKRQLENVFKFIQTHYKI